MKSPPPAIHPFMVTTLFVLVSYREVQPFAKWEELLGLGLGALLVTYILFRLIKLIAREPHKAALLTTITIACFCFTSDVTGVAKRAFGEAVGPAAVGSCVVLCAAAVVTVLRTHKNLAALKMLLNVTISAMVAATIIQNQLVPVGFVSRRDRPREIDEQVSFTRTNDRPDIYYLIFDSYTSAESLKEYWGFDNSPFISALENKGFVVVSNAHANFDQTPRCLAATLNMRLPNAPARRLSTFGRVNRLCEIIDFSAAPRRLRELGYQVVNLSLFDVAGEEQAYHCPLNDYASLADVLVEKSLWGFVRRAIALRRTKDINEELLARVKQVAHEKAATPRFVYLHVMTPHWPYFYDRNGPRKNWSREHRPENYLEQLIYVNGVITNLVAEILQSAEKPPIIVLQGDHGFRFIKGKAEEEGTRILNAYHLPGGQRDWVYDGITPVNTFRMIFNHYFGANYGYWPDVQKIFGDELTAHARTPAATNTPPSAPLPLNKGS